jgi:putative heme-binding domain-containing protein
MKNLIPVCLLLVMSLPALAQRDAKVPDPDPELERKTFILPEGFEVNLFAADPLLAKPIQMNWDPQGRLWIATSETYPQIKPGEKANDKIIVLEDTDGDGKADRTTVFADGLLIPTGIEPGDGGAYVANSTELVHLSASKPGQKADTKRILLSGFGTEDTHHIIHTFRWGPDCRLYFNQSIYIHSHVETPHGVRRLNAGGIWRFNPDTWELDVFARGWINSWGHAFDNYGQSFATDGANGEGINHVVPGGYYPTAQGPHAQRVLHGLNPGSPKHCGLEIVSGRHFPDDWQGDCITCDFRGHRVCRFKLSDDGSTFASREMTEVIKSNHPAFRPVDVKMGPDGALYVADWYNPIIQHGEVDFRDPRRDKTHGRIWRVTAKGRPLVPKPKLVNATVPELLEHLKAPEQWTRQQAKRVLKERGKEKVVPIIHEMYQKCYPPENFTPQHLLDVVFVLEALGECERMDSATTLENNRAFDLLNLLLKSKSGEARAMAVRILSRSRLDPKRKAELIAPRVHDAHPRVRMEAIRAAPRLETAQATEDALAALDKPMDRVLDYALWLTVRELEPYWLPEFQAGKLTFGGDARKLAFALNAIGNKDTVKPVVALLDGGTVPRENLHGLYLLLAQIGGPEELGRLMSHAASDAVASEAQRAELARAVEDAVRTRKVGPPKDVGTRIDALLGKSRLTAFRLIGLWKVEDRRANLVRVVETFLPSDVPTEAREGQLVAIEAIGMFGDEKAKQFIMKLCTDTRPEVQRAAISALVALDLPGAARFAARHFEQTKPEPAVADLYAAFLARKGGASALAKALAGMKLDPEVAKLGLQAVRASTLQVPELTDALTKAGDLSGPRKPPTEAEVKALAAEALKSGDPARGELVYRRKELQCLACHAIAGAGGQVGPDMTSIGASAQPDYLVESLLLPAKAVKEGYHAIRVITNEDRVFLGIKVRETDGLLVLRTAEDKEVTIPVKDIAERGEAKSLMPEGLTDTLTRQEFADLVAFLSTLGKVGTPYAANKARLVRRWQVLDPTPQDLDAFRRGNLALAADPLNTFRWQSAYSKVSGELPLGELPKFAIWNNTAELSVLRFHLDVTTAGKAMLRFNSVAGLSLYLGGTPVEPKAETVIDLPTGLQPVTVVIDRSHRSDNVRVELDDVPGSPVRVAVVGGK